MEQPEAQRIEADWLPPVAALSHFEPPAGAYLAAAAQARREDTGARYGFRVGSLGLLINPNAGSEVLTMPHIAVLPGSPRGFLGLSNLRGNLVPVYDLRLVLGVPPGPASENLVLVLGGGDEAVGLIVEGYPVALTALRPLSDFPQLPDALHKHVPAGHMQDDRVWLEFDHRSFFEEFCSRGEAAADAGKPETTLVGPD